MNRGKTINVFKRYWSPKNDEEARVVCVLLSTGLKIDLPSTTGYVDGFVIHVDQARGIVYCQEYRAQSRGKKAAAIEELLEAACRGFEEEWRRAPAIGTHYYYPALDLECLVASTVWRGTQVDEQRLRVSQVCSTRKEARHLAEMLVCASDHFREEN